MESARIPPLWNEDDEPYDPVLDWMKGQGVRITRANYIACNWDKKPRPWTAEHEAELPQFLQDWGIFEEK